MNLAHGYNAHLPCDQGTDEPSTILDHVLAGIPIFKAGARAEAVDEPIHMRKLGCLEKL